MIQNEEASFTSATNQMKEIQTIEDLEDPVESIQVTHTTADDPFFDYANPFCRPGDLPGIPGRMKPHRIRDSLSTSMIVQDGDKQKIVHKKVIAAQQDCFYLRPFEQPWFRKSKVLPNFQYWRGRGGRGGYSQGWHQGGKIRVRNNVV